MRTTFLDVMLPQVGEARGLRDLQRTAAVLFVTVITVAAAQISISLPFTPVPFTFQPMVVLVGAAALGARLGAASQILYLALGIAGLPVFAASPLLPQGMWHLSVEDFPAIVTMDAHGNSLHKDIEQESGRHLETLAVGG